MLFRSRLMHLLATTSGVIDGAAEAVDLKQSPADIVVLSAADSEIAALARAYDTGKFPTLRLANFLHLQHNLSVDLYLEKTLSLARLIVLRLLGGASYWPYGLEQIEALAKDNDIKLVVLPGDSQPDPDLDDLVNALTRETAVDPGLRARSGQEMGIPRPLLLTRLLVVLAVLLIGGMAGLMIWLGSHMRALVVDLREHQHGAGAVRQPPLPSVDDLRDDGRFAQELARAPDQAARLMVARGHLLMTDHRPVEAVAAFAAAARHSELPLSSADRLEWAAAQIDSGDPRAARVAVLAIDHAALTPAERGLAAELLTRCVQVTR